MRVAYGMAVGKMVSMDEDCIHKHKVYKYSQQYYCKYVR